MIYLQNYLDKGSSPRSFSPKCRYMLPNALLIEMIVTAFRPPPAEDTRQIRVGIEDRASRASIKFCHTAAFYIFAQGERECRRG